MNLESQVALLTIRSQPKTILDRLLQNEDLLAAADLVSGGYPDLGAFDHHQVVSALQKIDAEGCAVTVRTKEGKECRLERQPEGIKATPIEDEKAGRLVPEFQFLAPLGEDRLKALSEILSDIHPWFPSASKWQVALERHSLSETELTQLVAEIQSTPPYFFTALEKKWRQGSVSAQDLIPSSLFYYQSLLGPLPEGRNADAYIHEILKPHLQSLVERDLSIGLKYCLPAYLRDDLSPFSLLNGIADKAVLDAISDLLQQDNPVVLLGILDIAARRKQGDIRFEEIASEVVKRLMQSTFTEKDELDSYELLTPLVRLCYRLISIQEALYGTPPFWRWLAAFVHSSLLYNVLRTKPLDVASFSSWCESHVTQIIISRELLDMHQEPLWTTDDLSPSRFRAEISGRLINLCAAIQQQGAKVPFCAQIESKLESMKEQGELILTMFPGPLEGHFRRKSVSSSPSSDGADVTDFFKKIISDLDLAPTGSVWIGLSAATRLFLFDSVLMSKIDNVTRHLEFQDENKKRQSFFDALSGAALIAASQPDETLAESVAATLAREAVKFNSGIDVEAGFRILIMASSAFIDRLKWLDWLGPKMENYVYSLPKGNSCLQIYQSLQLLETLFPVKEWCFGRAIKLAVAGLR